MKKQIRVIVCLIVSFISLISPFMEILVGATDHVTDSYAVDTYELRTDSKDTFPFPVVLRDFEVDNIIFDGEVDYWYVFGMVNKTLDASKKPSFTDEGYHHLVEMAQQDKIKIPDVNRNGWIDKEDKDSALQEAKDWYKTTQGKSYETIKAECENSTYRYVVYHANQLFNDVEGLNLRKEDQISLRKNQNGVYAYYDSAYFPLDNQLFGNTYDWCKNSNDSDYPCDHNYHFTLESHTKFYYDGESELYFEFLGDDDVWVYVNNQLVIDIGGVHGELPQKFVIREGGEIYRTGIQGQESDESLVAEIPGAGWYDFDFYFMERHINQSNLKITTNMEFNPDIKITKIPYLMDGDNEKELDSDSVVYPGQTIYYKFQIENSGNVDLTNIILEDPKLNLKVSSSGVYINNQAMDSCDYQIKIGDSEGDLSVFGYLPSKDSNTFNTIEISSERFNYLVTDKDVTDGAVINLATVTGTYENSDISKFSKTEVSVGVVPLPSLTLTKEVIGSGDTDDLFTIQVQGSDGTAFNVRLQAGETVTLEPMKYGVTYTIKEIVPMNYTLTGIEIDSETKNEVTTTTDKQQYDVVITNEVTNTKWFQFKTRVENFVAQVKAKFSDEGGSK